MAEFRPDSRADRRDRPKKDPAKPTRAKAARPDLPPIAPALAELLNPGIGRGTAGVGSQTGLEPARTDTPVPDPAPHAIATSPQGGEVAPKARVRGSQTTDAHTPSPADAPRRMPLPTGERHDESKVDGRTGLQPPPDNSRERRADFAAAHTARKSTEGFSEAPQSAYRETGERAPKSPLRPFRQPPGGRVGPGELDPDIAKALGIEEEDGGADDSERRLTLPPAGEGGGWRDHIRRRRAARATAPLPRGVGQRAHSRKAPTPHAGRDRRHRADG